VSLTTVVAAGVDFDQKTGTNAIFRILGEGKVRLGRMTSCRSGSRFGRTGHPTLMGRRVSTRRPCFLLLPLTSLRLLSGSFDYLSE